MTDDSPWVILGPMTPHSFTFVGADSRPVIVIRREGLVEIGEGFTPTEAGKRAIEAMQHQLQFVIDAAKQSVRDEFEALGYKIIDGKVHRLLDGKWVRIIHAD